MRRRNPVALPDWFALDRYTTVRNFALPEWYINLARRHLHWEICRRGLVEKQHSNFKRDLSDFFRSDNLVAASESEVESEISPIFFDGSLVEESGEHAYSLPIGKFIDFAVAIRQTPSDYRNIHEVVESIIRSGGVSRYEEHAEFMSTAFDDSEFSDDYGLPCVEINLHAPDSLILDDFKKWLKGARSRLGFKGKTQFTPANLRSWADNQVLPYIDLIIWSKSEGFSIDDRTMGEILFPDDFDTDAKDRVAKTVRPKAEWLMRSHIIRAIREQAARSQGNL